MLKKIKNKKYHKTIILILILVILLTGFFIYSNFIDYISVLEKQVIYSRVIVGDIYGFELSNSSLIFGEVIPGNSASKEIEIANNQDENVRVKIYSKGKISQFIKISENNFILSPSDTKKVIFSVQIPSDAEYGTYEGEVIIKITNPLVK